MTSDSSPAFQRLFFKVLQAALGELFQAHLSAHPLRLHKGAHSGDFNGILWESHADSLQHNPCRSLISQDEVTRLQRKHYDTSVFTQLEEQLKHRRLPTTE
ncbi:hypothetical protein NL108_014448 [Boleophthalmus pectinirostris]|nr:hypothetical protein NL108_014448 [Boleophthalmus pectinirostris]